MNEERLPASDVLTQRLLAHAQTPWEGKALRRAETASARFGLTLPPEADLRVTLWRGNDRLTLPGGRGSRSLKRLCVERGIPPGQRDRLPVLRLGEVPAAVPGIGVNTEITPPAGGRTVVVTFYEETEENHHEK